MLTKTYLKETLIPHDYQLHDSSETPIFWKKVRHRNQFDKMAFTLIVITMDTYTITIEGVNEMLIRRAVAAGAIVINSLEELDALRDIIYDNTLDCSPKEFETIFFFFEKQLTNLSNFERDSAEHQKALENINLLVLSANRAVM